MVIERLLGKRSGIVGEPTDIKGIEKEEREI